MSRLRVLLSLGGFLVMAAYSGGATPALAQQAVAPLAATGAPDEAYFMTIYGFEGGGGLNLMRNSHTFALFVKATGADLNTAPLASFLISWLPADDNVGFGNGLEPGRNFTLAETLGIAASQGFPVTRTAIYKISGTLYRAALARKELLDWGSATGRIAYKMIDDQNGRFGILSQDDGYTNCIHAISDALVIQGGGLLATGTDHGYSASSDVFQFFSGMITDQRPYDQWLQPRLGI